MPPWGLCGAGKAVWVRAWGVCFVSGMCYLQVLYLPVIDLGFQEEGSEDVTFLSCRKVLAEYPGSAVQTGPGRVARRYN